MNKSEIYIINYRISITSYCISKKLIGVMQNIARSDLKIFAQ